MRICGFILVAIMLSSCLFDDRTYRTTEFVLENKTDRELEVITSAVVTYHFGPERVRVKNFISPNESQSMRVLELEDSFDIREIFTSMDVYQDHRKSRIDPVTNDLWHLTDTTGGFRVLTLSIDSTFFVSK